MSVNKHEGPKEEEMESNIKVLKKNMKIPSTVKLVGVLTDQSFDVHKKKPLKAAEGKPLQIQYLNEQPYIKISYGHQMKY